MWILGTAAAAIPLVAFPIELFNQTPGMPKYTASGKLVGALVCTVIVMLFWHAGRLRAEVTAEGVTVFGFMRKISLPWAVIDGFALRGSLRVRLTDGRAIPIPGFRAGPAQAAAGNRPGRRALAALTSLRASAVSGPPPPSALTYKPYVSLWVLTVSIVMLFTIALV